MSKFLSPVFAAAVLYLLTPAPAYAYVDAGSASVIITAILGFIGAMSFYARTFWVKIKGLFSKKK
ncbi:MAG: hypothetical protein GY915_03475 [bacterium]|nr:hypothetical protein [bacterium]